jgi:hypothetical protein
LVASRFDIAAIVRELFGLKSRVFLNGKRRQAGDRRGEPGADARRRSRSRMGFAAL